MIKRFHWVAETRKGKKTNVTVSGGIKIYLPKGGGIEKYNVCMFAKMPYHFYGCSIHDMMGPLAHTKISIKGWPKMGLMYVFGTTCSIKI